MKLKNQFIWDEFEKMLIATCDRNPNQALLQV